MAVAACALVLAVSGAALATPLDAGLNTDDPRLGRRLTEAELAGIANLDGRTPGAAELTDTGHYIGASPADARDFLDRIQQGSFLHATGTGSPFEILRSAVNVQPGASAGRRGPPRPRPDSNDPVLGMEAQEWLEDAVRNIVNSTVDLRITEQGRTAFAVLGAGEFSIAVSQDHRQIALVSGEDVLLTADRNPQFPAAGMGMHSRPEGRYEDALASTSEAPRQNTLQQMLEKASEIATHPLSLLVYALVAAYAILWNMLESQGQRRVANAQSSAARRDHARAHHRSHSRSRSRRRRRL